ncbi:DUF1740-domain-containing protein [Schizopora paradoxa]|uniref:DUF1740-domain-containing protein n=1 Tax=Schizopora paradoxa TaxID=27342 RepID=A0A0H2RQS7_9AGAM|nr:DUF1740-domain-containing protein [Schizopora paradoxa]
MSAPSFNSFPPIFSSFPDLEAGPSSRQTDDAGGSDAFRSKHSKRAKKQKYEDADEESSRKRDKRKHRDSHARTARDGAEHGSRTKHRGSSHREGPKDSSSFLDDERLQQSSENRSKLYFSDHKGDSLNVVYGGLHSGDIPKYSFVHRGKSVLGVHNANVTRREGRGIVLEDRSEGRTKAPQLSDKRTRKLLETSVIHRLNPSSKTKAFYEESDGFIRISSVTGKDAISVDQPFRSIPGQEDESSSDTSEEENNGSSDYESDPDTISLSAREEALRRLEQEIKEHPSSTSSWLSLLEHSLSGIASSRKDSGTARPEISVSILHRAIKAQPDNIRSPILRLKLLKAGEDIWDDAKLESEWESALKNVKHPDIWMEWFDWRLRKCPQGLEGCVQDVKRVRESGLVGLGDYEADILNLRVFWRLALLFRQSGYVERGTACFQAQAELNFKVPNAMKSLPFERLIEAFEDFWEYEAPRIGESTAKGWSSWNADNESTDHSPASSHRKVSQPNDDDPYIRWAANEQDDKYQHFPLRTFDDDEGDPYRTILFADISPFLFPLRTRSGKDLFRLIWLHYAGARIPGLVDFLSPLSLDERWAEDLFASPASLSSLVKKYIDQSRVTQDSFAGAIVGREKRYRNSFRMTKLWGYETRDPFESMGLNGVGRQWEDFVGDEGLVRSVFKQLQLDDDSSWLRLWLAFETTISLKGSSKVSKSLLADNKSSPSLWSAHAHIERMRGRFDDARKVYQTVLALLPSDSDGRALICWDYAEMEWLLGRTSNAFDIIVLAAGQQNSKGDIQILRSKRVLEDLSKSRRAPDNWKIRAGWLKLRTLLELLRGSVEDAMNFLDNVMFQEEKKGPCHEHLAVFSLTLVYHHTVTLKNPAPRILLRNRVSDFLRIYPFNSIILALFLECEKGEGVWGRVRDLLGEKPLTELGSKSLSRRVAEVWISGWEEDRWKGEVERVKASLESAIICDETRGSPIIWRILLEVEINYGSLKRAKTTLFRALGECPMVKYLYLLAFGPLRQEFTPRELNQLADTMSEKGIRLRRSLDEIVDHGGSVEAGDDSDGPVDELEYNSRELRRLMPY